MMRGLGVQDALVALLAVGSLGWLLRRSLLRRRAKRCSCDGCPAAEAAESPCAAPSGDGGLVTIEGAGPGKR